jgi:hypothetical protein
MWTIHTSKHVTPYSKQYTNFTIDTSTHTA